MRFFQPCLCILLNSLGRGKWFLTFSTALVVEKFILETALATVFVNSGHELFISGTQFAKLRLKNSKTMN
jgi:hypothetical protein